MQNHIKMDLLVVLRLLRMFRHPTVWDTFVLLEDDIALKNWEPIIDIPDDADAFISASLDGEE